MMLPTTMATLCLQRAKRSSESFGQDIERTLRLRLVDDREVGAAVAAPAPAPPPTPVLLLLQSLSSCNAVAALCNSASGMADRLTATLYSVRTAVSAGPAILAVPHAQYLVKKVGQCVASIRIQQFVSKADDILSVGGRARVPAAHLDGFHTV